MSLNIPVFFFEGVPNQCHLLFKSDLFWMSRRMSRLRIPTIPGRVTSGSSNRLHTTAVACKDKLDLSFNDHEWVYYIKYIKILKIIVSELRTEARRPLRWREPTQCWVFVASSPWWRITPHWWSWGRKFWEKLCLDSWWSNPSMDISWQERTRKA